MTNSTLQASEADRLYVAIRLKVADTLMADLERGSNGGDDWGFWERTHHSPAEHIKNLLGICEDGRVFALAEQDTEDIRAFVARTTKENEGGDKHLSWKL